MRLLIVQFEINLHSLVQISSTSTMEGLFKNGVIVVRRWHSRWKCCIFVADLYIVAN